MPPPHLLQDHQLARDMMLLDVGRPSWTVADARTRGGRTRAAAVRRPCPTRAPAVIYIYIYIYTHTHMYIYTCIHSHAYYRGAQEACWPAAAHCYIYIYITAG